MLLDSIAAAVESQTTITCEQLRNISKNMKEFVEGGEMTSFNENKKWRNLTFASKTKSGKNNKKPDPNSPQWGLEHKIQRLKKQTALPLRQQKQSQQNYTQSCKMVGLTLTKISSFQKRPPKQIERKKHAIEGSEFTPVCNQKSLRFHSDDPSKRCWGIEKQKTDTSQTLKIVQHDNLLTKRLNCITNKLS